MSGLTHAGPGGEARMVDVGPKPPTHRLARAEARIRMKPATARTLRATKGPKGDALQVARLAGIQGAKRTSDLIPLCHPLSLTSVAVDFDWPAPGELRVEVRAEAVDRTGVEMEALTAAAAAALTVYDMAKAVDRGMEIRTIRLLEKSGGKSGRYVRGSAGRDRAPHMKEAKRKRKR